MTTTNLSNENLSAIIVAADEVLTALAGTNDDVHPDNSTKMCGLWDDLNDRYAPPAVVKAMARELLALWEAAEKPVVYMWDSERKDIDAPGYYRPEHLVFAENSVKKWGGRVLPLYTAPQPPNAPDDLLHMAASAIEDLLEHADPNTSYYSGVWADVPGKLRAAIAATPPLPAEPYKLPMQPLVVDSRGTLRFKENTLVRKLLDFGTEHGYGLNQMAVEDFTPEDRMQLAQLIGYSLSGYGELSYVTDESYDRAIAAAPQLPGEQ
jgi:hypothetical protein